MAEDRQVPSSMRFTNECRMSSTSVVTNRLHDCCIGSTPRLNRDPGEPEEEVAIEDGGLTLRRAKKARKSADFTE